MSKLDQASHSGLTEGRDSVAGDTSVVFLRGVREREGLAGQRGDRASIPHVGRRDDLARVIARLGRASSGEGQIVLVEGEPGIGKTRLVDEALSEAESLGFRSFYGGADELDRRPFSSICRMLGVHQGAEGSRGEIARLLAGTAEGGGGLPVFAGPSGLEHRVTDALLSLVENEALDTPIILALEDLQWADPATILALQRMGSHISQLPALVLGTARPVPPSRELELLIAAFERMGAETIDLSPLGEREVAELLRAIGGGTPGPSLMRQAGSAGGNPFFVIELFEALRRDGAIDFSQEGTVDATTGSQPLPLAVTILHRLSFLTESTLDVLRVASVLGTTFEVADLAMVMGRVAADLVPAVRESTRSGVLRSDDARLAFRHELIRSALYQDLPEGMRTALHAEAGRVLGETGRPVEDVAEHVVRGASKGDRHAVLWLRKAAEDASLKAPAVAAALLGQCLEIVDPADPMNGELLADRAVNLMWAGRMPEAETLCRDGLAMAHPLGAQVRFRECLAYILLSQGRAFEALTEADEALATGEVDESNRGRLEAWTSQALFFLGRHEEAVLRASEAKAAAGRMGDDFGICLADSTLAGVAWCQGRFRKAVDLATDAVAVADRSPGRVGHRFHAGLFRGVCLSEVDEIEEGMRALQLGREITEVIGARWNLSYYHYASAMVRFLGGQWDDAVADLETGNEVAEEHGTGHRVMGLSVGSMIALHRGDVTSADEMAAAAEREFMESGPSFRADWMGWSRALVLEASQRPEEALGTLGGTWDLCNALGLTCEQRVLAPDLVRLAVAGGDRSRAEAATSAVEELAKSNPGIASLDGAALYCRGLLTDDAEILFRAVDSYERSPRTFERASAHEAAGMASIRARKADDAKGALIAAKSLYESLDASHGLARVHESLRGLGVRPGVQGERGRPKIGWEALTETELRVAGLVEEGMPNLEIGERLFISRNTVKTHVAHILAKLGLRSRVELAASMAKRK